MASWGSRYVLSLSALIATAAWAQQYTIGTLAGNGVSGFLDGQLAASLLNQPVHLALDSNGNLYVADSANHRVRLISISSGTISTIAGTGTAGYGGNDGSATAALLANPSGLAVDSSGALFIGDTGNRVVRKISGGNITTVAGDNSTQPGNSGDGGSATVAQLRAPTGVAVDSNGNLYIADTTNDVIRRVSNGIITSYLGSGLTAGRLKNPIGLAFDSSGVLYIADSNNHRVLKYTANTLSTVAGNGTAGFSGDGGPANRAQLSNPTGVAVDATGSIYIADSNNSRIRKVLPDGNIVTIAGNGRAGYSGDGGSATSASLNFPRAVAVDRAGLVYIADRSNHAIRVLTPAAPTISENGVVNSWSYAARVSPGAWASIFGIGFGSTTAVAAATPLPPTLGGISVSVNGVASPIHYVSPGQINFQVPWSTQPGAATVTVGVNGVSSNAIPVPVVTAGPGLYSLMHNAPEYSVNSPANAAPAGSTIVAYLTGSGPLSTSLQDGVPTPGATLVSMTSAFSATIGPLPALVSFGGMTPGSVGLAQMNIVVPAGLAPGAYPLTVTIDGQASNSANINVR